MTRNSTIMDPVRTTHSNTHTRTRSPETWRHYPNPELVTRGPGIPATHIDELPNRCRKTTHWARKQGAEALSIFEDSDTGEYYVHAVVPSNDWIHGPFNTESDAESRLTKIKNDDHEYRDTTV